MGGHDLRSGSRFVGRPWDRSGGADERRSRQGCGKSTAIRMGGSSLFRVRVSLVSSTPLMIGSAMSATIANIGTTQCLYNASKVSPANDLAARGLIWSGCTYDAREIVGDGVGRSGDSGELSVILCWQLKRNHRSITSLPA